MSNDQKQVLNLYGILDNEMSRMHNLMQTYLTLPQKDHYTQSNYGGLSSGSAFSGHSNMPAIYKRILEMQDLMLKALIAHDTTIQDKVAELALTGVSETK